MNELEQRLRSVLARRDPPPGFTERVMSRIRDAGPRPSRGKPWLAAAAIVAMVAGGALVDAEINRRVRGERARQEVLMALRVTGSALNTVSDELRELRARRMRPDSNEGGQEE